MSEIKTLNDFLEDNTGKIWRQMKEELPTGTDPSSIAKLKSMVAYADSVMMDVSEWYRRLGMFIDNKCIELLKEYNDECKESGEKPTATGREQYLKLKTSTERRWKNELEDLQGILKSRVMLGQAFLKSSGDASTTAAAAYNIATRKG